MSRTHPTSLTVSQGGRREREREREKEGDIIYIYAHTFTYLEFMLKIYSQL